MQPLINYSACENDSDCPESQKCDLGKCDCVDGFVQVHFILFLQLHSFQDMTRSGVCKVADAEIVRDVLSLESLGVDKEEIKEMNAMKHKVHNEWMRRINCSENEPNEEAPETSEKGQLW